MSIVFSTQPKKKLADIEEHEDVPIEEQPNDSINIEEHVESGTIVGKGHAIMEDDEDLVEAESSKEMEVLCLDSSNDDDLQDKFNPDSTEGNLKSTSDIDSDVEEIDSTNDIEPLSQTLEEDDEANIISTNDEDLNSSSNHNDPDSTEEELLPEIDSTVDIDRSEIVHSLDSTEPNKTEVEDLLHQVDSTGSTGSSEIVLSSESTEPNETDIEGLLSQVDSTADMLENEQNKQSQVDSTDDNSSTGENNDSDKEENHDTLKSQVKSLDDKDSSEIVFVEEHQELVGENPVEADSTATLNIVEKGNTSTNVELAEIISEASDKSTLSTSNDSESLNQEQSYLASKPVSAVLSDSTLTPRRSARTKSFTDSPMPSRTPRRRAVEPILEEKSQCSIDSSEQHLKSSSSIVMLEESSLTPRRTTRAKSITDSPIPTKTPRRTAVKPILEEEPTSLIFEEASTSEEMTTNKHEKAVEGKLIIILKAFL